MDGELGLEVDGFVVEFIEVKFVADVEKLLVLVLFNVYIAVPTTADDEEMPLALLSPDTPAKTPLLFVEEIFPLVLFCKFIRMLWVAVWLLAEADEVDVLVWFFTAGLVELVNFSLDNLLEFVGVKLFFTVADDDGKLLFF